MKHNTILILGGYGNVGLAISRLLVGQTKIGIILAGLLFFLWQLPSIFLQANFQLISPLWGSLGWGWYLSMLGTALTLLGAFWQDSQPVTFFNSNLLSERKHS